MTSPVGASGESLRVALIGSGPSGFYAAEHLLKSSLNIAVDMFERLPTPYGLVRGGVAPDHPKIKTVTRVYEKIAAKPGFRFFGNVELGRDVSAADLRAHYHAIVYAVGAQSDRRMGIPGEDLPGSHAATEFVGWYNAHPDYRDLSFDLSQTAVAVIGNGNVAMDVARILASTREELAITDIADYALEALSRSSVTDIYLLGRRGPAQAAFTNPELKEMGELHDADVIVLPDDAALDPLSEEVLRTADDRTVEKNVQMLQEYAERAPQGRSKRIHMRFLVSPTRLIGTDRVEAIEVVHNALVKSEDGSLRPRATERTEVIPVGLVFRSIGYMGVPLADVPFDARQGVIPNRLGRVIEGDSERVGEYVVGWIKRGPSGIIGTNKPDSQETADQLLSDFAEGKMLHPAADDILPLLKARGVEVVTFDDWLLLDAVEQARGQDEGRPRRKFARVEDMLDAIQGARESAAQPSGD
ncbi:MAG: FAD-dependent oxidoreductase [Anaerolineae bacterium]|nr:FAD-dependent oxidoreductase [Anaerolineae bacterium]NUQ06699.1 FAD-dependent oxidoreductase [Anaerolineae bacterium]